MLGDAVGKGGGGGGGQGVVGRRDSWCGISRFYNILGLFPSVEYYGNSCNTLPRVEPVTLVLRASEGEMVLVAGMPMGS